MAEREEQSDKDKRILQEAKDRFKRVYDWEADFRNLYKQDVKFANADSDNGWQWPEELRRNRELNKRPALTINKTAAHIALVTNDQRQNKPSISIKPTSNEGTFEAAQIYEGIVRNIEYVSAAQAIYDETCESQVEGGIGYWRVITDYIDDETFDQQILISPVQSHMGVALDSDIKQKDGSDALYGFVFDDVPRKEFEKEYPKVKFLGDDGIDANDDWVREDSIRMAEYYRIVQKADELIHIEDQKGHSATFKKSEMPPGLDLSDPDLKIKRRKIKNKSLEWYKIAGNQILDRRELPGKYVPIVRVVGKERVIEGKLERKGLTRSLKDPQRMYNYNSSGQVEYGALATKSPWVGPAEAFEGNENAWKNANTLNAAYLTYKHRDEDGQEIPAPMRPEAPGSSPAFVTGMQIAEREMEMASGQYAAQQGQPSNEKSGVAITARQRQGDTATYHFIDNLSLAIRFTGKIIIDLVPYVYDTERVIKILGKDGQQTEVMIDPTLQAAMQQKAKGEVEQVLFNPKVGKYEVASDIGPNFATQRQEAWNAFVQVITGNPELVNEIGDLMFQSADFPLADKIAERMKRKIKNLTPWLLDDDAPSPKDQAMQQQLQQATQMITELLEKLGDQEKKLQDQRKDIQIKQQDSISKRITAVSNAEPELSKVGDTAELQKLINQSVQDALKSSYDPPPNEAALKAPDGNWYIQHPETGQYHQVMNNEQLG